jgi:hypothetical protein
VLSKRIEATKEARKSRKSRRYHKYFKKLHTNLNSKTFPHLELERANALKLLKYIQQAAACKTIGILSNESGQIAESFLSVIIVI